MRLRTLISTSAAAIVIMASPVNAFAAQHAQLTPPIEMKCSTATDLGCSTPSVGNDAVVRFTPFKSKPTAIQVTLTFGSSDLFDSGEEIAIASPDGTYVGAVNASTASRTSVTITIDSSRPALLAAALSSRRLDVFAVKGSAFVAKASVTGRF